jgi:hypothetical protein
MELLGDVGQVEARFGLLGEGVCAECTMGMQILVAPDGPPR